VRVLRRGRVRLRRRVPVLVRERIVPVRGVRHPRRPPRGEQQEQAAEAAAAPSLSVNDGWGLAISVFSRQRRTTAAATNTTHVLRDEEEQ
jgi:hypothetical protein